MVGRLFHQRKSSYRGTALVVFYPRPTSPHMSGGRKKVVMAGSKPDYQVFVSREGSDKKAHYTQIGAGWKVAKDGISVLLQSTPLDGKLVLFPVREE
jgi:hypothetical protein